MRVDVRGLTRRFGQITAVDNVSFSFEAHEICGFVGPNGAGKTTTMRALATLDQPDAGDASIGGLSITADPEKVRRLVGFMPDSLPTQRDISVHHYLDFFARAHRLQGSHRTRIVESIEGFTGLGGMRERDVASLSKGMKQRLSLARALIHDPPVLILDEPAAGLDPRARVELRELLQLLAAQGKAILVSSHILGELSEICTSTVIIESGRVVRSGSLSEIIRQSGPGRAARIRVLERQDELLLFLLERPETEAVKQVMDGLELVITGDESICADLLKDIVMAGFPVVELRWLEGDLETVFLQVTRGELQ